MTEDKPTRVLRPGESSALERPAVAQRELMIAALLMIAGWTLIYMVMFDQGATLDLLLGGSAQGGVFHELFHDGRHLAAYPCH